MNANNIFEGYVIDNIRFSLAQYGDFLFSNQNLYKFHFHLNPDRT